METGGTATLYQRLNPLLSLHRRFLAALQSMRWLVPVHVAFYDLSVARRSSMEILTSILQEISTRPPWTVTFQGQSDDHAVDGGLPAVPSLIAASNSFKVIATIRQLRMRA